MNMRTLRQHPLFRMMPGEMLSECCWIADLMLCAPGDIIAQKGESLSTMYFLIDGTLHLSLDGDDKVPSVTEHGKQQWSDTSNDDRIDTSGGHVVRPPAFLGAAGFFKDRPLAYTVSCITHIEVLSLSRDNLDDLCDQLPEIGCHLDDFLTQAEDADANLPDCSIPELNRKGGDIEWEVW